jgi:diguanylate cyclase (GGDEF)-like protein/PAS domain S-box-containing protein
MRTTASSLIGVALVLWAAIVMSGWLLSSPALLVAAGGGQAPFNTALCVALVGLAFVAERLSDDASRRRIRTGLGVAVTLIAGFVLLEHLFDPGINIDLPEFHRSGPEDAPNPGRMSLPTTLALVLLSTAMIWMGRVRGIAAGLAVQALTGAAFLIGLIGLGAHAISLPLMYPDSAFARMARETAIALVASAVALGLAWRHMEWYETRSLIRSEEQRIGLTGAAVLALIVCAAVLSGFAIMAPRLEAAMRSGLLESAKGQIELFRVTLDLRTTRAGVIATRPYIVEQLARAGDAADAGSIAALKAEAESALQLGFSAVSFHGLHGEARGAAGRAVEHPALVLPIQGAQRTALLWDDGFVLYIRRIVERDGQPVGVMVSEQRLTALDEALRAADDFASTAEIRVCRKVAADVECVRQSPQPVVFRFAYSPSVLIARALEGETTVVIGRDDQRRFVMAAIGPIGKTGLAMMHKLDTVELYAPLRKQMYLAFALMAAMTLLGAWLLRRRIAPLVRKLAASEERFALAIEGSRLALWDLDLRAGRIWLDERWQEMLGGKPAATTVTAGELERLVHPEDLPPLQAHLKDVLRGAVSHYDVEHRVRKLSGDWLWIRSSGRVVERDPNGRPLRIAGTNSDIDRRKHAELLLAHQAGHDALSGLPNRNLFQDRLQRAVGRSRRHRARMAVMYLDIDKFKGINDTLGHHVGDELIRQFARRLGECVRSTDTVARLGGDEFAVILEELEDEEAGRRIAEKIVAAMRDEFNLGEARLSVSTSLGMAFYRGQDGIEADLLVRHADEALYQAKAAGRNTYRVSAGAEA